MPLSTYNKDLFSFLSSSPTPFHAVANIEKHLNKHGFHELSENQHWQLSPGKSYFVSRQNGATIAFTLGTDETVTDGFRMLAAHTDSPCLQIKPRPEILTGSCLQLGVEVYGGSLLNPWFDRDLSLAGRVCLSQSDGSLSIALINFQRPLLTIPSVAIHFDREANKNRTINQQTHLPPIISQSITRQFPNITSILAQQLQLEQPGLQFADILSFDLFCYDSQPPHHIGLENEMISAGRLDNLLSCHVGLEAISKANGKKNVLLYCANHEENGSTSATGAHGSFLDSVLQRIIPQQEQRLIALSNSFLISMDNAHASHPNYMDKIDTGHAIELNSGPVIKINANQRYATSSTSSAVYKQICKDAEVTPQEFVMRSDMACGSTIGPITAARLGLQTIDVGAASLGMHSIREHTGSCDPYLLYRSIIQFVNSDTHHTFTR